MIQQHQKWEGNQREDNHNMGVNVFFDLEVSSKSDKNSEYSS